MRMISEEDNGMMRRIEADEDRHTLPPKERRLSLLSTTPLRSPVSIRLNHRLRLLSLRYHFVDYV